MNTTELKKLADQCICHPASRSISDVESAGEAIKELLAINAELVEALKNMLGEFNEQTVNGMVHDEFIACMKARAALAKAEGGEL